MPAPSPSTPHIPPLVPSLYRVLTGQYPTRRSFHPLSNSNYLSGIRESGHKGTDDDPSGVHSPNLDSPHRSQSVHCTMLRWAVDDGQPQHHLHLCKSNAYNYVPERGERVNKRPRNEREGSRRHVCLVEVAMHPAKPPQISMRRIRILTHCGAYNGLTKTRRDWTRRALCCVIL